MFDAFYREGMKTASVTYVKFACQESVASIPFCYNPIGFRSNGMIYYLLLNCHLTGSHTCAFKSVYLAGFISWLWNTTREVVSLFLHGFACKKDVKYTILIFLFHKYSLSSQLDRLQCRTTASTCQ